MNLVSSVDSRGIFFKVSQITRFILILSLPLTIFFPIGDPWHLEIFYLYVTPGFYFQDIPLLVLLSTFLLNKKHKIRVFRSFFCAETVIMLFIVLAQIISISGAISKPLALFSALRWIWGCLVIVLVFFNVESKQLIWKALVIGLMANLLVGLLQIIHKDPIGLPFELALDRSNPAAAVLYLGSHQYYRPYGLTFHPNVFGGFMFIGLWISTQLQNQRIRAICQVAFLLGVLLSFSRSAWFAVVLTGVPFLFLRFKNKTFHPSFTKSTLIILALSFIIMSSVAPFIINRLSLFTNRSESSSILARGELIAIAIGAIIREPLRGIGTGNFPLYMLPFDTFDQPHYVHNVPLLFASQSGIFAGLAWLLLWCAPLFSWLASRDRKISPSVLHFAWIGIGLIGLWDNYPVTLENFRLLIILILILIIKERNETGNS